MSRLQLDVSGHHGVETMDQEHWGQVPGQQVQLVQISLVLVTILRNGWERKEEDSCVGTFVTAIYRLYRTGHVRVSSL